MSTKNWFDVDKEGLAKILERRGKVFALYELISNAWDTDATEVKVTLEPVARGRVHVTIEDDDPEGFSNLTHAYTLFAESSRKGDAGKRGRFNLGEKLVLATCDWAEIKTTTGTVRFDEEGRKHNPRAKRDKGSVFIGLMRMTRRELEEVREKLKLLIAPQAITTTINGQPLPAREHLHSFEAHLPTEIADEEGNLRRTVRKTTVEVYQTLPGETTSIYELGVPVVETGDKYHVSIGQKIPLNMDRDNVTPAYLRELRALVLNEMSEHIDATDASCNWVREAAGHPQAAPEAVTAVMTARFGDKRVAYDPSDIEANKLAVAAGYTVVHGGSLSAGEWENAKRAEAILPAGKVTPSPKPFHPDGDLLQLLAHDKWTPAIEQLEAYIVGLHARLIGGARLTVQMVDDAKWGFNGTYGKNETLMGPMLRINLASMAPVIDEEMDRFLLHEFAHDACADHLDKNFAEAGFKLGAKLKRLALDDAGFFVQFEVK